MLEPMFHYLLDSMRAGGAPLRRTSDVDFYLRLALVFGSLCHRRGHASGSRAMAAVLGGNGKAEERRYKIIRFQSLIAALNRGPDEAALTAMRRALMLVNDEPINLYRLVRDLLTWPDARIEWTFAYFGQSSRPGAEPANNPHLEEDGQ